MGDWVPGVLMLLAIAAGAVGVFMIYVPAGWIFICLGLATLGVLAGRGSRGTDRSGHP